MTKEEFIDKAQAIHEDNYDYSEIDYQGLEIKIKIVCKEHGPFMQYPSSHLLGRKCVQCRLLDEKDEKRKEFIEKAQAIHGDNYDYSEVVFIDPHVKVKIICHEHGSFEQNIYNHLRGSGCKLCRGKLKQKVDVQDIEQVKIINENKWQKDKNGKRLGPAAGLLFYRQNNSD